MYLLDTNHCSRLIDGHPEITARLTSLGNVEVATCVIVRGELRLMVERSERRDENHRKVQAFLKDIKIYPVDSAVADIYGGLKAKLLKHFGPRNRAVRRKTSIERLGFKENDLWIAATVLKQDLVVVTLDGDFSRMKEAAPELRMESWLSEDR